VTRRSTPSCFRSSATLLRLGQQTSEAAELSGVLPALRRIARRQFAEPRRWRCSGGAARLILESSREASIRPKSVRGCDSACGVSLRGQGVGSESAERTHAVHAHTWTQEQGLPQDTIRAIAQTADGYLWLGTDEGLARFDGYEFVIFSKDNGDLPSNSITALSAGAMAVFGSALRTASPATKTSASPRTP